LKQQPKHAASQLIKEGLLKSGTINDRLMAFSIDFSGYIIAFKLHNLVNDADMSMKRRISL